MTDFTKLSAEDLARVSAHGGGMTNNSTERSQMDTIPLPRIHSTYAGGEVMGVVMGENDQPDYLLIDLGVEPKNDVTWGEAKAWAESVGGDLPTRREQAVMFGNRREGQYQPRWYWSGEAHASEPSWAWSQHFDDGYQDYDRKGLHCRARAVRRVPFK